MAGGGAKRLEAHSGLGQQGPLPASGGTRGDARVSPGRPGSLPTLLRGDKLLQEEVEEDVDDEVSSDDDDVPDLDEAGAYPTLGPWQHPGLCGWRRCCHDPAAALAAAAQFKLLLHKRSIGQRVCAAVAGLGRPDMHAS